MDIMSGTGSIISQTIAHLPEKEHGPVPIVDYSSIRGKVHPDAYVKTKISLTLQML